MTRFEVVAHPWSAKHLLFKVTYRGRVYACASAWEPAEFPEDQPNAQTVEYLWKHERHQFLPYDESTGRFTTRLSRVF